MSHGAATDKLTSVNQHGLGGPPATIRGVRQAEGVAGGPLGDANPPLLTGGLKHCGELLGVAVDALTVTVEGADGGAEAVAAKLLTATELDEPGRANRGFAKSEKRLCMGGHVWRKWEPHQPSRKFGSCYESWECESGAASWLAGWLRGRGEVKPTRVDVAVDLVVPDAYLADDFVREFVEPHLANWSTGRKPKLGISGEGGVNTLYVGSAKSSLRVRTYRKDLQDACFAELVGPVLRVELVMREEWAERFWRAWEVDEDAAKRAAAGQILRLTGFDALIGVEDLPELETPEESSEAQQLALWIEQNGGRLLAWSDAGIDVVGLCREAGIIERSRVGRWRHARRVKAVARVGAELVSRMALALVSPGRGLVDTSKSWVTKVN